MTELSAPREPNPYNATLIDVVPCNDYLRILRVRPDAGVPPFSPGQYVTLALGFWEPRAAGTPEEALRPGQEKRLCKRPYSLSHPLIDDQTGALVAPAALDFLELYVTLIDSGAGEGKLAPGLTPRLWPLAAGARLHVARAVVGEYTLAPLRPDDDVLFCATGTGEAPHNAMLADLLSRGHRGRIASLVGTRYRHDLGYLRQHRVLEQRHPRYRYVTLTTREPENEGKKRYLQDLIADGSLERDLGYELDPKRTHVFLCGNPEMIGIPRVSGGLRTYPSPRGIIEVLEGRGFEADNRRAKTVGNVHFEEYW